MSWLLAAAAVFAWMIVTLLMSAVITRNWTVSKPLPEATATFCTTLLFLGLLVLKT